MEREREHEVFEYDRRGRLGRRTGFLHERTISWLPVSEPVFLLGVLAALVGVWLVVALVLSLT